ncbi:MAG: magnesium transporter [Deferribacteres bacterium]|nr:magnesium transporter [candidate division KSB1 bacterium]MCB9502773.1 magnesium transporter [Deferribacteres bacterium]
MRIEEIDLRELTSSFEFFIKEGQKARLQHLLISMHPSDIASVINRISKDEYRLYLFNLLDKEAASDTILKIDEAVREDLVELLEREILTEIVDEMESDDATDFIAELPDDIAKDVLESVEQEDADDVKQLMQHREDTAGGIMALEIVSVNKDATVDEAIMEIRKKAEEIEEIYTVFVVDNENKLVGQLSMKSLILARGQKPVAEIMERDVASVHVNMDQEDVAHYARKYDLVSIPVVDDEYHLLGRITIDDIMDVVEEEAAEDLQRMAGISDEEELREPSAFRIVRGRIPWLIFGLVGGLWGAEVIKLFEGQLSKVHILAIFIPSILSMGGNIGMQSSAIIVRGLATSEIDFKDIYKRLFKELKVSLINGIALGMILFVYAVIRMDVQNSTAHKVMIHPLELGMVVGLSLLTVILVAGFVGTTVPLLLKRIKIDPALATGPFITTSNDIIALFIYFAVATLILHI